MILEVKVSSILIAVRISAMFQKFVQRMNNQTRYNSNGKINAIRIITYHDLTYSIQDYNAIAVYSLYVPQKILSS